MGKNVKKVISLVLVFAMILTGMTFTGFDAKAADAANDTSATAEYEIYPTPRSVVYQDSSFTLADKTNVVYDSTIDEATQKRLNEVLAIQNITGTVTGAVASNGMNVLVGTKGSDGAVEKWFNDHVTYADDLFDKRDAYVLAIQDNVIAVLGKDTDAAFYGLSSLKMIFNQVTEKAVRKLQIEDYAIRSVPWIYRRLLWYSVVCGRSYQSDEVRRRFQDEYVYLCTEGRAIPQFTVA